MTRTTIIADRQTSHLYGIKPLQEALDAMWTLLENRAEDVFRMTALNEQVCVLDEDLLGQLMALEPAYFAQNYGSIEEHNPENRRYEWIGVPDYLLGTYTIRGRYTVGGTLIENAKPAYYFSEAF